MSNLRKMLPSTRSLFVFEAVARHLNFKQAAYEMNVTQPSISHAIKEFEHAIGVKLFNRTNRGVVLTSQGDELYHHVRNGFDELERGLETIQTKDKHYITFVASASLTSHWLVEKLPVFQRQFPQIKIRLFATDRDMEAQGELDLTIWLRWKNFQHKSCWYLADEVVFPVCSPDYLINADPLETIEDLSRHRLIHAFDPHRERIKWQDWFNMTGHPHIKVEPEPSLIFNNHQMATQAVLAGTGVALGWSFTEQLLLQSRRLICPLGQGEGIAVKTGHGFFLIANGQSRHFKIIKKLAEWMIAQIPTT